jgi:hypothetical protein
MLAESDDAIDSGKVRRAGKLAARIWMGFGAVFALAGLACIASVLTGNSEGGSQNDRVGVAIGTMFALVGAGIIALGVKTGRDTARRAELVEQHPDAPWMWNPEWAAGRIEGAGRAGVIVMWLFAAVWNLITWPILPKLIEEYERGEQLALVFCAFPLLGVVVGGLALRASLQQRKFGTPLLLLETIPGVVGGHLRGAVQTRAPLEGARQIDLTLTCVRRRTTGSGKNRSTHESILFQEKGEARPDSIRPGPWGSELRLDFRIPFDSSPTDLSDSDDTIEWRVEVEVDMAGVDLQARFDVPVFRTDQSSEHVNTASDALPQVSLSSLDDQPALPGSKVKAKALPAGGVELYFGACRNPGSAFGLTFFWALWMGFVAIMLGTGAPILFPIVFSLFGLLILGGAVHLWAGSTRVRASRHELEVRRSLAGIGRTSRHPVNEIEALTAEIGMTAGKTAFYRLIARKSGGSFAVCGDGLRDKREAEAYALLLRKALGLPD